MSVGCYFDHTWNFENLPEFKLRQILNSKTVELFTSISWATYLYFRIINQKHAASFMIICVFLHVRWEQVCWKIQIKHILNFEYYLGPHISVYLCVPLRGHMQILQSWNHLFLAPLVFSYCFPWMFVFNRIERPTTKYEHEVNLRLVFVLIFSHSSDCEESLSKLGSWWALVID